MTRAAAILGSVAAIGLLACFASGRESYQYGLALVLIWAAVGSSWNIISGYGGQIAFGHAVFFGIGAYVSTLLMAAWHVSPALGLLPGMAAAVLAAAVIGWPTLRLSGVYFSLASLTVPLMCIPVLSYLGLQEVSMPFVAEGGAWYLQFDDPRSYSVAALALLLAAMAVVLVIEGSKLGASLLAVRDDQWAAEAAGIDAHRTKLAALAISAAVASAAGTLYASLLLIVTPQSVFGLGITVKSLMVTLVGGLATVWGPLIGAAILIPLGQVLLLRYGSALPGIDNVVLGLVLIAAILLAPEGLYWKLRDLLARRRPTKLPPRPAPVPHAQPLAVVPGEIVLQAEGLTKSFAGVVAVDDVSVCIRSGELVGLIGPNGAGKTTLMNLVNGFVRPGGGTVLWHGRAVTGAVPWAMRRRGLARTFQVPRVLARRTVLQNVELGAFWFTRNVAEARQLGLHALARVGLEDQAGLFPAALSTSGLRKLELARAIVGRTSLLLLDEPLAGLSGADIAEFSALIGRLRGEGLTIVVIEHTMSAMVTLVDRFIVLDKGQLLMEGTPASVMADPGVIEAYLGKGWAQNA